MSNQTMVRISKPAKEQLQRLARSEKRSMANMLEVLVADRKEGKSNAKN